MTPSARALSAEDKPEIVFAHQPSHEGEHQWVYFNGGSVWHGA